MIYVLKTVNAGPAYYKIGYTKKEIKNRIRALQTGCPYDLELVKTMRGSPDAEKILHAQLSKSRVNREWFYDNFEVRERLKLYDWKASKWDNFQPTPKQQEIITALRTRNHESWYLPEFLEEFSATEDDLRLIPFRYRNFDIHFAKHESLSFVGKFNGQPFHGEALCLFVLNLIDKSDKPLPF